MFTIRTGEAADAPAVLGLWREAGAEPSHTDDVTSLHALVERDPAALIVAEVEGRIVGSVIAGWDGWRGSIYRLAVAPKCRRQGLGHSLVAAAENRLRRAGAVRLQAIVVEGDLRAEGFWQSIGWEQQDQRVRFVRG